MPRRRTFRAGFSLVEIAIAIGIAAFTLSAIIGVFGVANESALDSNRDTFMASMIGQVMGDLRALPFDVIFVTDPHTDSHYGVTPYLASLPNPRLPTPLQTSLYYFTSEGVLIETATTPPSATAYTQTPANTLYRCRVYKTADVNTKSFTAGGNPVNRLQLTLRFDWPVPPAPSTGDGSNVKMYYESISRYF